jgi:hypothetical protein
VKSDEEQVSTAGTETREDEELSQELTRHKQIFYLQFFRFLALLTAIVVEIALLSLVLFADLVVFHGVTIPIRGIDVPILRLTEVLIGIELLRSGVKVMLADDPELRKVET